MARCAFIKPGGDRCGATAMKGYDTCYGHREDLAEERKRNASKGGKSGGRGRPGYSPELAEIKALLKTLTDRVIGAEDTTPLSPSAGAVAGQLINARLRAVEVERKIKETEELEARIEELEQAAGDQKGGRKWGA
jgi:hypothetical protein